MVLLASILLQDFCSNIPYRKLSIAFSPHPVSCCGNSTLLVSFLYFLRQVKYSKAAKKRKIFFNTKLFKAVRKLTGYQGNQHHTLLVIRMSFVSEWNKIQLLQDLRCVSDEVVAHNTIFHLIVLSSTLSHTVKRNGQVLAPFNKCEGLGSERLLLARGIRLIRLTSRPRNQIF